MSKTAKIYLTTDVTVGDLIRMLNHINSYFNVDYRIESIDQDDVDIDIYLEAREFRSPVFYLENDTIKAKYLYEKKADGSGYEMTNLRNPEVIIKMNKDDGFRF